MKFKRSIAMLLKENENVTIPKDEFWKYSAFKSLNGDAEFTDNDNFGLTTNVYSGGGTRLRVSSSKAVYISGAAFTAD